MLFHLEEQLYALSSGQPEFLFSSHEHSVQTWLEDAKKNISAYLVQNRPFPGNSDSAYPSDPDIDVYQCLGTVHSLAGRWLFYLGTTSDELNLASNCFMKVAHYFSRIGLAQRVDRCLAIAGRVHIRMNHYEYAEQLRLMAYDMVQVHLHEGQREAFKQSVLSEIYLLQGEYALHAKADYMEGLRLSLLGLKGAMWLGLARRTSDNLYNIWKCAQYLGDKSVEPLLKDVFPILWTSDDLSSPKEKKARLNPLKNRIAEEVIKTLFNIQRNANERTWSQVAHQFQKMSSNIWHRWYRESSSPNEMGKHPIGKLIDDDQFLNPLSP